MTKDSSEEPKLIIDEDWKTQVQREKDELQRSKQQEGETADQESTSADAPPKDSEEPGQAGLGDLPPASFALLLTSLATQAMAALGQVPDEEGKPLPVNLDFARHFIDLIGMLVEKTKGNLTDDEAHMLQDALHQLRMLFVAVSKQIQTS